MNNITLTKEELEAVLECASMGGAGLLDFDEITSLLDKVPEEIRIMVFKYLTAADYCRKKEYKFNNINLIFAAV